MTTNYCNRDGELVEDCRYYVVVPFNETDYRVLVWCVKALFIKTDRYKELLDWYGKKGCRKHVCKIAKQLQDLKPGHCAGDEYINYVFVTGVTVGKELFVRVVNL